MAFHFGKAWKDGDTIIFDYCFAQDTTTTFFLVVKLTNADVVTRAPASLTTLLDCDINVGGQNAI